MEFRGCQDYLFQALAPFEAGADGTTTMSLNVAQSGVDDKFRMPVPIYLELDDSRVVLLGRTRLTGNNSIAQKVPLKGLKAKPRRVLINYYDDVLATPD